MVAATPAAVERAFASHGVLVSRVSRPPELCDRVSCDGVAVWGGKVAFLAPSRTAKADFMVVLVPSLRDATRIGTVERRAGLGTARRGPTLLVYLPSSPRIARLRGALAAVR
jgi:hypothetical protein